MAPRWTLPNPTTPYIPPTRVDISPLAQLPEYFNKLKQQGIANERANQAMAMREQQMKQAQAQQAQMNDFRNRQFDATQDYRNRSLRLQEKRIAQAGQPSATSYGRTGSVFQGPNGEFYTIQFGSDGSRKILPVQTPAQAAPPAAGGHPLSGTQGGVPLSPSKGTKVVGDTIIDSATGEPIRNVAGNIAGAERAKKVGAGEGEREANRTKYTLGALNKIQQGQSVDESIGLALEATKGYTTGIRGTIGKFVPGSDAYVLSQRLATIKANIGFDKLQAMRDASPTGGALGQVSEMENRLLQSVWGSVEQAQTPQEIRRNLTRFRAQYKRSLRLIRRAYEADYGAGSWEQATKQFGINDPSVKSSGKSNDIKNLSNAELMKRLRGQ